MGGGACSKAGDGPLQGLWESSILFVSTIGLLLKVNNIIHDDNTILNNIFVTQKELKKMEIDEINKKYEIEEGIRQWTQEINNRLYDN